MGWLLTMYSGSPSGPYLSVRRMPVTSSLALNTVPSDSSYTFHLSGPTRSKSTEVVFVVLGSIDVGGGFVGVPRRGLGQIVVKRFWLDQARSEEHTSELQSHHDLVC